MPLNLISDPWIPVLRHGRRDVIRPDQIVEEGVERPDWPRPDLNLACLEFLIGLVYLACPPEDGDDWEARAADVPALRMALAPLAPAFNLTGQGPLFLQDFDPLPGEPNGADMLFIDSSGGLTARNNADLMVKRGRYSELDLPMAAMALFALQAHAPSGGAGNRTSMRGGGPMVTLARPGGASERPLWTLVWANVPEGEPLDAADLTEALPWMRPTRTSEDSVKTYPPESDFTPPEAFFGMPRRLRLVTDEADTQITGVIQKNYGTNYAGWVHPLTPHYQQKEGTEKLPRHPKPGGFGYRNWPGVVLGNAAESTLSHRAQCVEDYGNRRAEGERASILVAGWAMDNMKPLDFLWSEQPLFPLSPEAELAAAGMVQSAGEAGGALAWALRDVLGVEKAEATSVARAREEFFARTQAPMEELVARMSAQGPSPQLMREWLEAMRRAALGLFDAAALPGLAERDVIAPNAEAGFSRRPHARRIVEARSRLQGAFAGWRPHGPKVFGPLGLELPAPRRKQKGAA